MKTTSILAAVLAVMAGSAYAADFAGLQTFKAADVAAASSSDKVTISAPIKETSVSEKDDLRTNTAALKTGAVYANTKGCVVKVLEAAGNQQLYVVDEKGQRVQLGIGKGFKSGYIGSYCMAPRTELNFGDEFTMSCYPHYSHPEEDATQTTRGLAGVKLQNGISDVFVRGEVRIGGEWKIETDIRCDGLSLQAAK